MQQGFGARSSLSASTLDPMALAPCPDRNTFVSASGICVLCIGSWTLNDSS
jgi:hypothetical protein